MYIFYKIYLQWIYWTLFFIARVSKIFASEPPPNTYSVGPSSVVWSELGPAPPFPPMRVLEVYWSRALSLVCEVALSMQEKKT